MSRCLRCGQDNEKTARFCVGCGEQLSGAAGHSSASAEIEPDEGGPTARGLSSQGHDVGHQLGRQTPHSSTYGGQTASPGLLPQLIVPGTARLGLEDGFESAAPAPSRSGPPSASLAFAETSPPLLDADLHRPIPDRGANQPRFDVDPTAPRLTYAPPESVAHERPPPVTTSLDPLSVSIDAPRVLAGFLVSYEANALGQSWSVYQGSNLVGRLGAIAGADIELPHATVSSRHALLQAAAHPGRLLLRDQSSTNGSFVNDTALQPDERRELHDGDRVRFGLFTVIVKII